MRRSSFALVLLLTACAAAEVENPSDEGKQERAPTAAEPEAPGLEDGKPPPGVKVHGNLPIKTESELAAEDDSRDECVRACVTRRQAEARGADAIEADCRSECLEAQPISQVEVVPDGIPE